MSTNGMVDKENVVHVANGILFTYKKKRMKFAGNWVK